MKTRPETETLLQRQHTKASEHMTACSGFQTERSQVQVPVRCLFPQSKVPATVLHCGSGAWTPGRGGMVAKTTVGNDPLGLSHDPVIPR